MEGEKHSDFLKRNGGVLRRYEMVRAKLVERRNVKDICSDFGVTSSTVH